MNLNSRFRHIVLLSLVLLLGACSSSNNANSGRYELANDKAPTSAPDVSKVEDAHPRYEPYSRGGNKSNYTVLGKSYKVLDTGKGFTESGYASWYGSKFHGHLTSNGETYDMYSMSAAHKSLPLPSYVKVTNKKNNKQVIVRVNDRGPFHEGRIIDLSYAAAHRLDMLKTGTASVDIEVIFIESPESIALANLKDTKLHYIQVLASSDKTKLTSISKEIETKYQIKTRLLPANKLFKLQVGPIGQRNIATKINEQLKQDGFPQSYLISE
ncbi:septal ring lytic transglycosylase RlpA family protein [Shewanella sp. UCD-KL12]|uniref:septal ring lytic transglycosylase RlpA family protein n=1 Tax=Shewanella sp. UCD-KL12 TaxID=1917163 RepID=UPI0009711EE2|nr:septal ring lytic transglycosylase RlpA family protein [Shewanella sp. UCD-KL12]